MVDPGCRSVALGARSVRLGSVSVLRLLQIVVLGVLLLVLRLTFAGCVHSRRCRV